MDSYPSKVLLVYGLIRKQKDTVLDIKKTLFLPNNEIISSINYSNGVLNANKIIN